MDEASGRNSSFSEYRVKGRYRFTANVSQLKRSWSVLFRKVRKSLEFGVQDESCLLYTSDAADERSSVDLGGRRIIKKKN